MQGIYGPDGTPFGEPLKILAPFMGSLARHRPRRPIFILDVRLDADELVNRSGPAALYQLTLADDYSPSEMFTQSITFALDLVNDKVDTGAHPKKMKEVAAAVAKKFKQ